MNIFKMFNIFFSVDIILVITDKCTQENNKYKLKINNNILQNSIKQCTVTNILN